MLKMKQNALILLLIFIVFLSGCLTTDVIQGIGFTEKTYINATDISVVGAASTSGSVNNLSDINQGYFNISESTGNPFYAVVNFTNITSFSFLEVKARYFSESATPSTHVVNLQIYCDTDSEYEDLFFLENAGEWRYFTRHFPDTEHFIDSSGNVSIKFNHESNGNSNHRLWIDAVRLIILPQYEQNNIVSNQYFNTTGTGGISFDGNPVNLNGSNMFNGTISNYSTLDYTNTSLSEKVNKTGDNMTGNLKVLNVEIGSINNSAGFEMNATSFYGSFDAYNDSNGGYMSLNANAFYDPIGQKWYKKNISQYAAVSAIAYYKDITISQPRWFLIFSAPSTNPFTNHDIAMLVDPNSVNIYKNTTISPLAMSGAGNYSIVIADSTGKLIAVPMNGTGNHYGCFNVNGYPYPGNPGC